MSCEKPPNFDKKLAKKTKNPWYKLKRVLDLYMFIDDFGRLATVFLVLGMGLIVSLAIGRIVLTGKKIVDSFIRLFL